MQSGTRNLKTGGAINFMAASYVFALLVDLTQIRTSQNSPIIVMKHKESAKRNRTQ